MANATGKTSEIISPAEVRVLAHRRFNKLLTGEQSEAVANAVSAFINASLDRINAPLVPPYGVGATSTMYNRLRSVLCEFDPASEQMRLALATIPGTPYVGLTRHRTDPPATIAVFLRREMVKRVLPVTRQDVLARLLDTAPNMYRFEIPSEALRRRAGSTVRHQARLRLRVATRAEFERLGSEWPFIPCERGEHDSLRGLIRGTDLFSAYMIGRNQDLLVEQSEFEGKLRLDLWGAWTRTVFLWDKVLLSPARTTRPQPFLAALFINLAAGSCVDLLLLLQVLPAESACQIVEPFVQFFGPHLHDAKRTPSIASAFPRS